LDRLGSTHTSLLKDRKYGPTLLLSSKTFTIVKVTFSAAMMVVALLLPPEIRGRIEGVGLGR
jgi:hypothetical protein